MSKNSNLTRAKKAKNDEFYTQSEDVYDNLQMLCKADNRKKSNGLLGGD